MASNIYSSHESSAALKTIMIQISALKAKEGSICDTVIILDLLKQCSVMESSILLLIESLGAITVTEFQLDIKRVNKKLLDSMNSIIQLTKDFYDENGGKNNSDVWSCLLDQVHDLAQAVSSALFIRDNVNFLPLKEAFLILSETLSQLMFLSTEQELILCSKDIISCLQEILSQTKKRSADYFNTSHAAETVWALLFQIFSFVPMLVNLAQSSIQNLDSKCHFNGQSLLCDHIKSLLKLLEQSLAEESTFCRGDEFGMFPNEVVKVLKILSHKSCLKSNISEICISSKPVVENIVKYAMAVTHFSDDLENKNIISACTNVLTAMKDLFSLKESKDCDFSEAEILCELVIDNIDALEQVVNNALMHLIVYNFANLTVRLNRLCNLLEGSLINVEDFNLFKEELAKFDRNVDQFFHIGNLVIVCCSDRKTSLYIEQHLSILEWLDSCITPFFASLSSDQCISTVRCFCKQWKEVYEGLQHHCFKTLEPTAFCYHTKLMIHHLWADFKNNLYIQDKTWIADRVDLIIILADNLLALNKLNPFISEDQESLIKLGISEVKKSVKAILEEINDLSCHKNLLKRIQFVLTTHSNIYSVLKEHYFQSSKTAEEEFSLISQKEKSDYKLISDTKEASNDVTVTAPSHHFSALQNSRRYFASTKLKCFPLNRLGDCRNKLGNSFLTEVTVSDAFQRSTETKCSTSIDITKFLSNSSSCFSSRKNYNLKVKEIDLDLCAILRKPESGQTDNFTKPPSSTSSEFAKNGALQPNKLTEITENITHIASSFVASEGNAFDKKNDLNSSDTVMCEELLDNKNLLKKFLDSSAWRDFTVYVENKTITPEKFQIKEPSHSCSSSSA